jgi:hypothetical protein
MEAVMNEIEGIQAEARAVLAKRLAWQASSKIAGLLLKVPGAKKQVEQITNEVQVAVANCLKARTVQEAKGFLDVAKRKASIGI